MTIGIAPRFLWGQRIRSIFTILFLYILGKIRFRGFLQSRNQNFFSKYGMYKDVHPPQTTLRNQILQLLPIEIQDYMILCFSATKSYPKSQNITF